MTLKEFKDIEIKCVKNFYIRWIVKHEEEPKSYPLDMPFLKWVEAYYDYRDRRQP